MNQRKHWYVIETKAKQEDRVVFYLHQRRIKTYVPKEKNRLLFPGYIFAHCADEEIFAARWIRGVKKVLPENKNLRPICSEISSIKKLAKRSQFKGNDTGCQVRSFSESRADVQNLNA